MIYLLITYISTFVASIGINMCGHMSLCKSVYDSGYKFNEKDGHSVIKDNDNKYSLIHFVPIINIIESITTYLGTINGKNIIIESLIDEDIIVKMEELDKEIYESNPTFVGILRHSKKVKKALKNAYVIYMNKNNQKGKIYFRLDEESLKGYKLIYREGSAFDLTNKEIDEYISEDDLVLFLKDVNEFRDSISKATEKSSKKEEKPNSFNKLIHEISLNSEQEISNNHGVSFSRKRKVSKQPKNK